MRAAVLAALAALATCAGPDEVIPPPCAALGCPLAPSGDPSVYVACDSSILCYCQAEACTP